MIQSIFTQGIRILDHSEGKDGKSYIEDNIFCNFGNEEDIQALASFNKKNSRRARRLKIIAQLVLVLIYIVNNCKPSTTSGY